MDNYPPCGRHSKADEGFQKAKSIASAYEL